MASSVTRGAALLASASSTACGLTHAQQRCDPAEVKALFSEVSLWQQWLEVEASLAEAQAECGIIPAAAARDIRSASDIRRYDIVKLKADMDRTRAPILSLARALEEQTTAEAGAYVHWGATTHNVAQTGYILLQRRAHAALQLELAAILDALADLVEDTARDIAVARTVRKHALPITFGLKIAAWAEEFIRQEQRFAFAQSHAQQMTWGGAAGAYHSVGVAGPAVAQVLGKRLGLQPVLVPSRAASDHLAHYILQLALFSVVITKVAQELYELQSSEIAELSEVLGSGTVGSSTMPQKINPKLTPDVLTLAAELRAATLLPAVELAQARNEGDTATSQILYRTLSTAMPLAHNLAFQMANLLRHIEPQREAMAVNVAKHSELICSENVMMHLARSLGRNTAHRIVKRATADVASDPTQSLSLSAALSAMPEVRGVVSESQIRDLLSPVNYTGLSESVALQMPPIARGTAARLRTEAGRVSILK